MSYLFRNTNRDLLHPKSLHEYGVHYDLGYQMTEEDLEQMGYRRVSAAAEAEVVLLNTCLVLVRMVMVQYLKVRMEEGTWDILVY